MSGGVVAFGPLKGLIAFSRARDWFGHPRGLAFLGLTGLWEVISLFGMKTILVFYLVRQLHFAAPAAVQIFGLSTAFSYLMSLAGGALGDRAFGLRRAVIVGSLLLAAGHFMLIAAALLLPGLILIAVGAGLFRPAMVAHVWLLYQPGDPRAARGLVAYKVACNIGGIAAPIICGALYEFSGWTAAVGFCGAGMLLALCLFLLGPRNRERPAPVTAAGLAASRLAEVSVRRRMALLLAVGAGGALHWTAANQQGGTLALWTLDSVNRAISAGGATFVIPAAWFQAINPILIWVFAPAVGLLWSRGRPLSPSTAVARMAAGSIMLAAAFLVLAAAAALSPGGRAAWIWLALAFAPLTMGELYLDPMGQALFSQAAPPRMLSTFVSLWMLTLTVGYVAAGWLAELWVRIPVPAFFLVSAAVALASALTLAASSRLAPSQ